MPTGVEQRLYRDALDDKGKRIDKAYVLVNELEDFAELSSMYFVSCQHRFFDRKELKAHDPVGYTVIEKMWRLEKKRR